MKNFTCLSAVVAISFSCMRATEPGAPTLSSNFTLNIQKTDRCQLGDADVIRADLAATNTRHALLTVESDQGEVLYRARLPSRSLTRSLEINLPTFRGKSALGVFICKDTANAGRCGNKPAAKMGDLASLTMFASPDDDRSAYRADKVYFYQPLFAADSQLQTLVQTNIRDQMTQFASFHANAKASLELLRITGSLPLVIADNQLQVPITMLNKKSCQRQARIVVEQTLRVTQPIIGWPGPIQTVERN